MLRLFVNAESWRVPKARDMIERGRSFGACYHASDRPGDSKPDSPVLMLDLVLFPNRYIKMICRCNAPLFLPAREMQIFVIVLSRFCINMLVTMQDELIGIFPTPIMRAPATLEAPLVAGLIEHFAARATRDNNSSAKLSHTQMLQPGDSPLLGEVASRLTPKLVEFGSALLGERMGWSVKEMWVNFLDTGGHQAMHNHANSFISGVIYLTPTHPGSQTVFMKSPGGTDFKFKNDHAGMTQGPFNADKWISPAPQAGDVILFPSYLLHAVPHNQGERRITLAFNAIPVRVDSWGYVLRFSG